MRPQLYASEIYAWEWCRVRQLWKVWHRTSNKCLSFLQFGDHTACSTRRISSPHRLPHPCRERDLAAGTGLKSLNSGFTYVFENTTEDFHARIARTFVSWFPSVFPERRASAVNRQWVAPGWRDNQAPSWRPARTRPNRDRTPPGCRCGTA